ncbi:isoprenyl transferase [Candidatus Magnetaquicoccus inordinatus]|uniref:isoprenyl transferase n=1 Tax=Candidatus Magnetaquicoccus inordinatus TaxID=2496818 RepID=UPI00102B8D22|nr:isoprenyl transferase [Candidatus Magnetaquicoccus inordinatus]
MIALQVAADKLPRHIAIVMDGNRRWARSRFLPGIEGHRQGVKAVRRTVEACLQFHIPILTLYTFSSENWKRPEDEVSALMNLLAYHLRHEMDELVKEQVRFRALGRLHELPQVVQKQVRELEERTADNGQLQFNIAVNYGGRQELVDAARQLMQAAMAGQLLPDALTEERFAQYLTTSGMDDPDLLIRTGGEQRISNFLLWQMAYTELIFLPTYWPDFTAEHLRLAIEEFAGRERRFGAAV